ncbi:TRAP transporter small permease [Thioclava sp. JE_KL1]|nr:TRAP transporter small permease [Thioclava sp. JE_KL1]
MEFQMDHEYRDHYPAPLLMISGVIDACLAIGGALIVIIVFSNAVFRGFGPDLSWSLEVSAFLMLWVTFLGAAAASARGVHMRVTEIFAALIPNRAKRGLTLVLNLIVAALMVSLIRFGAHTAIHVWHEKTTVLYWPVGLLYASMPVGIALALMFHLFNTYLDFTGNGPDVQGQISEGEEHGREGLA